MPYFFVFRSFSKQNNIQRKPTLSSPRYISFQRFIPQHTEPCLLFTAVSLLFCHSISLLCCFMFKIFSMIFNSIPRFLSFLLFDPFYIATRYQVRNVLWLGHFQCKKIYNAIPRIIPLLEFLPRGPRPLHGPRGGGSLQPHPAGPPPHAVPRPSSRRMERKALDPGFFLRPGPPPTRARVRGDATDILLHVQAGKTDRVCLRAYRGRAQTPPTPPFYVTHSQRYIHGVHIFKTEGVSEKKLAVYFSFCDSLEDFSRCGFAVVLNKSQIIFAHLSLIFD